MKTKQPEMGLTGETYIIFRRLCTNCETWFFLQKVPYRWVGISDWRRKQLLCPNGCTHGNNIPQEII